MDDLVQERKIVYEMYNQGTDLDEVLAPLSGDSVVRLMRAEWLNGFTVFLRQRVYLRLDALIVDFRIKWHHLTLL